MRRIEVITVTALLAFSAVGMPAVAAEKASAAPSASQAEARRLLDGMAGFLGGQKEFGANLLVGYEVLQASGQKIEFGERRTISVRRPNELRIEKLASDGHQDLVLFDGKQIMAYDAGPNVYAVSAQTGGIDETVVHFVRDLGMRLPLAPLLLAKLPEELQRRVQTIDYVEKTTLFGEPCHHLAGRTATVDFEMWIADGKKPLPRKIALTYRGDEGQPRFWAEFSDWDLDPDFGNSEFEFELPKDAKKVAFAAEMARASAKPASAPAPAEGAKR